MSTKTRVLNVRVVGFSAPERQMLNSIFLLSVAPARQIGYKLWNPEAGVAPDLILVDYHLAAETGIDCIGTIRAKAGYDVPAILITADRSPGVEEEARVNGLQLLRKPLKPAALRALMTRLHTRPAAAE